MPIRQAICYPMFRHKIGLHSLVTAAAEIGYEGIDIWQREADFPDIAAVAARHGMVIASCVGHNDIEEGLNRRENHARIEHELAESVDVAARHNIAGLICFSGRRRPEITDQEGIAMTVEGLRKIAPYAEKKGVTLLLELLNSKVDHEGYQADHTAWGVEVCRGVDSPRVKLLYDIYHMQIMEGDIIRTIRQYAEYIGHYHTAGNPGRNELHGDQELNYPAICRAIATTGRGVFVGHEFVPTTEPLEALRATYDLCNIK